MSNRVEPYTGAVLPGAGVVSDLGADGPAALARYTQDAVIPGTRRIVARTVASEPLDHYAAIGQITGDQYEAGRRLRALLDSTWPAARCTAKPLYASSCSDLDDGDDEGDEDERWAARKQAWEAVRAAERAIGRDDWHTVRVVCGRYWLGRLGDMPALRRGLSALVVLWR